MTKTEKGSRSTIPGVREQEENPFDDKKRRIINAARTVFLKYGYRRVTMNDLAQAAGISRPALYLVFPRKEDVFCGVVREMAREISEEVGHGLVSIKSPIEKLKFVCEIWMVRPFDWVNESPEAKEVFESSHEFAGEAVNESLLSFERDLASVFELFSKGTLPKGISNSHGAHLLAGSILGIKNACKTSDELRKEIHALIAIMIRI